MKDRMDTPTPGDRAGADEPTPRHTPGPWFATPTDPSEGGEFFWITATPRSNQEKEIGSVSGPQNARNAANARLIAAAPNMHRALERIWLLVMADSEGVIVDAFDKMDEVFSIARGMLAEIAGVPGSHLAVPARDGKAPVTEGSAEGEARANTKPEGA